MKKGSLHSSVRLLVIGAVVFVLFGLILAFAGQLGESSALTRVFVFMILIPPPVCFAAGIALAFLREPPAMRSGAWANSAALLLHGVLSILLLQQVLA